MKKYTIAQEGHVVLSCNSLVHGWNRLFPALKVKPRTSTIAITEMLKGKGLEVTINTIDAGDKFSNKVAEMIQAELAKITIRGQELTIRTEAGKAKTLKGIVHRNQTKLIKVSTAFNVMGKRLIPYLHGPAGSGKTEGAAKLAEALDLPFYAQSFHPFSEPGDIFGYVDAMGEVVETPFKKAYTEGGVYLADEMDSASGRVLTAFNMALSQNSLLFPVSKTESPKMLAKHKDFIFIAAGNTTLTGGNRTYSGRQELDGATIQRLTFIEWSYDTDFEKAMSTDQRWLEICWKIRKNIATHALDKFVISVRNIVDGDALLKSGFTYAEAIEMRITQGASQEIKSLLLDGIQL